jgi:hypothetical protein
VIRVMSSVGVLTCVREAWRAWGGVEREAWSGGSEGGSEGVRCEGDGGKKMFFSDLPSCMHAR